MKQSSHAWSRAYARQAQADLDAREVLLGATVPACQHLHFLQMACEKISKAHRCLGGANPETLRHSHGFAAKVLPQIARELLRRSAFAADLEVAPRGLEAMVRQLAREVDLLAPAVDDDGAAAGQLRVPLGRRRGRSSPAGRARVRASRDLAPAPCWRHVSQDRRRCRCGTCRWLLRRVVNSDCPFRPKTQALVRQELSGAFYAPDDAVAAPIIPIINIYMI